MLLLLYSSYTIMALEPGDVIAVSSILDLCCLKDFSSDYLKYLLGFGFLEELVWLLRRGDKLRDNPGGGFDCELQEIEERLLEIERACTSHRYST